MKRIAVVVCNSGLGHIKRVLYLLDLLCERSRRPMEISVFVDLEKLRRFPKLFDKLQVQKAKVHFQNVRSGVLEYEQEFLAKYKNELQRADVIWSDNLVFPLKYRTDVFLTGSFLWFEVMPDRGEMKREEEIFFSRQPVLIGNRDFATPRLQAVSSFVGVGMYDYFPSVTKTKNGSRGILLSCGGTPAAREFFKQEVPALRKALAVIGKEAEVFVEQDFCEALQDSNVKAADFSSRMFESVAAAATRPGMGTVCDTLSTGGRIFAFHEPDNNFEVRHNSLVLEKLNAGVKCETVAASLQAAFQYVNDASARDRHAEALKRLDFNGLDQTVRKIQDILN